MAPTEHGGLVRTFPPSLSRTFRPDLFLSLPSPPNVFDFPDLASRVRVLVAAVEEREGTMLHGRYGLRFVSWVGLSGRLRGGWWVVADSVRSVVTCCALEANTSLSDDLLCSFL